MEEELEIILQAVDNASDTFSDVSTAANDMGESLESSAEEGSSGFEEIESSAEEAASSVSDIDGSALDEAAGAADNLSGSIGSVDSGPLKDTADGSRDVAEGADEAGGALEQVSTIIGGIAGVEAFEGIAESLLAAADAAGQFNDSVMRAGLEAEGAGMTVGEMKDSVSELSETTGRAGGQIRESFIKATARGITDMDSFKTMMEGAGAQATLFSTDLQTMGNKFSQMAMRSTLMERSLSETGITMDELATAMGMTGATADEVKEKWKELDTNQRAAILGQAASMNEGKDANEEYKNSWAGLQEQLDIGKGRLLRIAGEVLLPVLIPAIQAASKILQGLGDAFQAVMDSPLGIFVSAIGSVVAIIALAIPAYMALSAAIGFITGPALAAAGALWAMMAPLLPFIAVAVVVAIAIYEIGKAFGWWTDVSSMLDAIGAGLQRMWEAFINHPDVQAAIQWISDALATLWSWITQAGQAVLEFFGISTGGDFDVVRALIESIGFAWQVISTPIRTVIWLLQAAWSAGAAAGDAIGGFYNDTIAPFAEFISGVFAPVWQTLIDMWNGFTEAAMPAVEVIQQFMQGNANLGDVAVAVITAIWNMWLTFTVNLSNLLLTLVGNMWSWASQAGMNFLNGIATYLSQLALRVYNYLNNAKTNIINQLNSWVSNARTKASQFVTGIISFISQLPARVYNYLISVVSRIVSAGQQWVNSAKDKAKEVVDNVGTTLSDMPNKVASALGGVASAIAKPFEEAYNRVADLVGKIKDKASELSGINLPMGGDLPMDGELPMGGDLSVSSGSPRSGGVPVSSDSPMVLDHNLNVTLDFSNVPGHISTEQLVSALTDKGVIRELVNNRDFQLLDNQAKERLNLKINRARGV